MPTFCRGWGALPFDRSSPDITAHTLRAWLAWLDELPDPLQRKTRRALQRGVKFLARSQRPDGSWRPLWFGNQFAPRDENPTYGTARVLGTLAVLAEDKELRDPPTARLLETAVKWLANAQNSDGGWGGAPGVRSSVEETALAVEALAAAQQSDAPDLSP